MRRLDKEFRELDPTAADALEPSGEQLLKRIVAAPCLPVRKPLRRRLFELAPVGLAAAAVAAVLLIAGLDGGAENEREALPPADEVPAAVDPNSILHYLQRWTFKGSGPATEVETREVWQAGDGSRQRVVYRPADTASFEYNERVTTEHATREFVEDGGPPRIIEYDWSAAGSLSAPAGYGLPADVGDPRTLPARAAAGERGLERLGATTVRDIRVEQFRMGACPRTLDITDLAAVTAAAASRPVIVSLAHDTLRPIRVEALPCEAMNGMLGPPPPLQTHPDAPHMPWAQTDYVSFEALPPTAENRRLLDMARHPGARVMNSKAIDRAEERAESKRSTPPTVTPTPTPEERAESKRSTPPTVTPTPTPGERAESKRSTPPTVTPTPTPEERAESKRSTPPTVTPTPTPR